MNNENPNDLPPDEYPEVIVLENPIELKTRMRRFWEFFDKIQAAAKRRASENITKNQKLTSIAQANKKFNSWAQREVLEAFEKVQISGKRSSS